MPTPSLTVAYTVTDRCLPLPTVAYRCLPLPTVTCRYSCAIAFSGVIAPEAFAAAEAVGAALLQITSYDKLLAEWKRDGDGSYVSHLLADVPRDATLVTVMDGHPLTLSWLGSVYGHKVRYSLLPLHSARPNHRVRPVTTTRLWPQQLRQILHIVIHSDLP